MGAVVGMTGWGFPVTPTNPTNPARERTAGDAGYIVCMGIVAGEGWDFVDVGETIRVGDEYLCGGLTWEPVVIGSFGLGMTVVDAQYPIRRPDPAWSAPEAPKWSCRHGRDPETDHCVICAVLWYKWVDS